MVRNLCNGIELKIENRVRDKLALQNVTTALFLIAQLQFVFRDAVTIQNFLCSTKLHQG